MALIETRGLNFKYPSDREFELSDIEFALERGEMLLLYGASGSGKSTLLKLLKSELAPYGERSGDIFFEGEILGGDTAAKIGYVGYDPEAAPVTENVLSELAYLPQNLGLARDEIMRRIAELCAYFGIGGIIDRKIAELSAGQKQLVNLAAVMTGEPKLLLLDEPTAQLDPHATEIFYSMLLKIRSEIGTAVILCEHCAEGIFHECDKVLYIENGAQKFLLSPDEAAKQMKDSSLFKGLPLSYRLSAALGRDKPLRTTAEAARFVHENYKPQPHESMKENTSHEPAIQLKGVYFRYEKHGRQILSDMDFTASMGEITAICGANGMGKSSLLKVISGVYKVQSGAVKIRGRRISSYRGESLYRGTLAMLPQNPHDILTGQSIYEDLHTTPDGEKRSDEQIFSVTDKLGLAREILEAHHFDLSGGELQRAALAKLLLMQPEILLLDEPEKGLDSANKLRLKSILRGYAADGRAVIFVTHDLDFAAETADVITMLFGGTTAASDDNVKFLEHNVLYTTSAARIAHGVFPGVVTSDALIEKCTCRPE